MPSLPYRLLSTWALGLAATAALAVPVEREHLTVELVAERTALVAGETAWLGLRLQHEPHWHTYWTNPGDTGLATRLTWRLPPGYAADPIAWPAPARLRLGELYNFGYSDDALLPVRISVPANTAAGASAHIELDASWLVCKEECIPGKATLSLDLPVAAREATPDSRWQALFAAAHASQPMSADWRGEAAADGDTITIRIKGKDLPAADGLDAYPTQPQLLTNTPMTIARERDDLILTARRSEYFASPPAQLDLVLVARHQDTVRAWQVATRWNEATAAAVAATTGAGTPAAAIAIASPTVAGAQNDSLWFALVLALLGGAALNLMPCVFPVLSLKALSLAEGAHAPAAARRDGLAYLAGAVSGFVALAAVLLALRAAGQGLGWGFQLQSPALVAVLAYLMIALGLSLSGVFVIGARLGGVGQSLGDGHGLRAAFFTGVLACVVASPCTAPFMGPALGYALTQPATSALLVFAVLGIGLASPIVVLSFVPALTRWLPRPGAWMNTFKQVVAWPLYLTAVWLIWVLMRQVGADAAALVLAGSVLLIAALAWYGYAQMQPPRWSRRLAIGALLLLALTPLIGLKPQSIAAPGSDAGWQAWTPQRLHSLRDQGQPLFVNMTAAWCISCLANERVALSSQAFRNQLREGGIVYLKGDWTSQDPAITAYLAEFQRSGVPLYVVYPRGDGAPEVLPQLLTPGLVADALARAVAGPTSPPAARSSP